MNDIVTINTDNYAVMAKAMGIAGANTSATKKSNNLNRLRIWHSPVMGQAQVNGKTKNVEVVEGGCYRMEILDGDSSSFYYAKTAKLRPFMQRYMYRRYLANPNAKAGEPKGSFHRTIMSDNLNIDLKDNTGRFNCGKPAGYVEDFQSLPSEMQDLIRQVKRVRVVFGTIELENPVDMSGKEVELDVAPVIWEIDNKDAYKTLGDQLSIYSKKERLPLQHKILLKETKENKLPNGSSFYTPIAQVDLSNVLDIKTEDHDTFSNFMDWVKNYNDYIYKEWEEKVHTRQNAMSDEDEQTVDGFIDIDVDEGKK
tara:strand:+ start:677 stop:1609 length:933 start_codon:yes stop_codon:yes gene_type:complete